MTGPWREVGLTWPIILPPYLYENAKQWGHDMRYYVKQEPIPRVWPSASPSPLPTAPT